MSATQLVRQYLDATDPADLKLDRLRELLADDFRVSDPMAGASTADEFVGQLRGFGGAPGMKNIVEAVIGQGDRVAVLSRFEVADKRITFSTWFRVIDDKIASVEVVYDPRPFLEMAPKP